MGQLRQELEPIWDTQAVGGSFTCYATALALDFSFYLFIFSILKICYLNLQKEGETVGFSF